MTSSVLGALSIVIVTGVIALRYLFVDESMSSDRTDMNMSASIFGHSTRIIEVSLSLRFVSRQRS